MSRVGKKPVVVPQNVSAQLEGQKVSVKGPKGTLVFEVPDSVEVTLEAGSIQVRPRQLTNKCRALWGTARARIANLIRGVTDGFEKKLEVIGVGYRASVVGKMLQLSLGYSHDIEYPIPAGVSISCPKPTEIVVTGIDKQQIGQVASEIRGFRPPEPYKGKGVKYVTESIFRKAGKKK